MKKIEFMERHLGDRFTGTISGVVAFGFFVLLDDYFVDGLVHVNALRDDYYEFRGEEFSLVGDRRGRRFRLGDRVPRPGRPGRTRRSARSTSTSKRRSRADVGASRRFDGAPRPMIRCRYLQPSP
jgi:hypothetical protein